MHFASLPFDARRPDSQTPPAGRDAFTLIELLVSMTVLVLLVVMVAQMVSSTSKVTGLSQQRLDCDSEARLIFEQMSRDFDGMIRRTDVDCSIYPYANSFKFPTATTTTTHNDSVYFFTQGETMLADSNRLKPTQDSVGVVGYRIWEDLVDSVPAAANPKSPFFSLDRLGACTALYVPFDRGMLFLSSATGKGSYLTTASNVNTATSLIAGTYPTSSHNTDLNYHCIGASVFRLEFGLLMTDGTYYLESPNSATQIIQDMHNVAAICVTMALLDPNSRRRIPGYSALTPAAPYTTDMQGLILAFADGNTPAVATDWNNTLAKIANSTEMPTRTITGVTRRTASQNIHVYQRIFYFR